MIDAISNPSLLTRPSKFLIVSLASMLKIANCLTPRRNCSTFTNLTNSSGQLYSLFVADTIKTELKPGWVRLSTIRLTNGGSIRPSRRHQRDCHSAWPASQPTRIVPHSESPAGLLSAPVSLHSCQTSMNTQHFRPIR